MRFSDSTRSAFQGFFQKYVNYKKTSVVNEFRDNPEIEVGSHEIGKLESIVRDTIKQFNIDLIEKFRKFPLELDGEKLGDFEPDFFLPNHVYRRRDNRITIKKPVLIEVHESFTSNDVRKHVAFIRKYGGQYYLILLAKEEDRKRLEELNQADRIYDELYPIEDIDYLIDELRQYKLRNDNGRNEQENESQNILPPRIMQCTGCGKEFSSGQYNRMYCEECMKIFEN
ncbi:MAG TPA: hypothetical protein VFA69_06165 [Candidatus Nitrosotalea sp.]|nr:hypothetical protein [Candidatus Nitrosotalea sp.]